MYDFFFFNVQEDQIILVLPAEFAGIHCPLLPLCEPFIMQACAVYVRVPPGFLPNLWF